MKLAVMGSMRSIAVFLILLCISLNDVFCLKNMNMRVPEAAQIGESVTMLCDYDLETAELYTIKWYRNELEFYRYVPKEAPPSKVFVMPHVHVDVSKSNDKEVTLSGVERETSGEFKCEVSADAPLFHTDIRLANLIVAEIPIDLPILRTDVLKLTPGAKLSANCTSPPSYPMMNLTWYINESELQPGADIEIHNTVLRYDSQPNLESRRSTLTINSSQDHFERGKMKLKCLGTMFKLYHKEKDVEIMEDIPQISPIREQSSHTQVGFNKSSKTIPSLFISVVFLILHYSEWLRK